MVESTARELSGATAVITGSSTGIGRAIALALADAGAAVVVHARSSRQAADESAAAALERSGNSCVLMCDLAKPDTHAELVEQAWNWRDGVDIWINNAGVDVLTGESAGWDFERKLEALWRVDVAATVSLSRAVGARMKARGRGTIINIGWDQAAWGMAGDSGELFAATKGAVMAFSGSLARSLAPEVRVNCVAPGWIKTSWGEQASDQWQRRAQGESLLGRWGTPEDVAAVVRFLVAPQASFITGQTIPVNGGFKHA
ncbi:MAG: SDR family NAD(P)-dependent oxidoreductase [Planctomycetota bacterium]|nr:MAG: SDR family NAD(P)-dependent oxidoreductase [Planctomycetota bacterium]